MLHSYKKENQYGRSLKKKGIKGLNNVSLKKALINCM
jgi:hypothetical protein